jgi:hypothetical protein
MLFDEAASLPFTLENGGLRLSALPGLGFSLNPLPLD